MIFGQILKILGYLLPPLLITIAVECTLVFLLFRKAQYSYYVLLLNILTNPLLNFIMLIYYSYFGMTHYYLLLYALEAIVVIVEGLLFSKMSDMKVWKALILSLVLNAGSYISGLFIFR